MVTWFAIGSEPATFVEWPGLKVLCLRGVLRSSAGELCGARTFSHSHVSKGVEEIFLRMVSLDEGGAALI